MGTHVNGPSVLQDTGIPLIETLGCTPLPYLFKVLSIAEPLSLQVHPDRTRARVLHETFPKVYKDPNHKPELAIALTPMWALCSFRPVNDLLNMLQTHVPEMEKVVSNDSRISFYHDATPLTLQDCFVSFMKSPTSDMEKALTSIYNRLCTSTPSGQEDILVLKLLQKYPKDRGALAPYWLNSILLQPKEAMFIPANEPHAYLSGDCLECMACSDNVVRAGLTSKFVDVDTLLDILSYKMGPPTFLKSEKIDQVIRRYNPPVEEFVVDWMELKTINGSYSVPCPTPSLLLVLSGEGEITDGPNLAKGQIYYFSQPFVCSTSSELVMVRAMVAPQ